ncbi:unnamed protein product [Vicia faba]|uniref:Viral late gene transcription factor 3 zinc ribbon domain-containing protein n=1 Tax=Vicia faba TaxID=3906 RepID=A0AAV0YQA3_VICFA|nr:unnamed protein product [Vicia faba]
MEALVCCSLPSLTTAKARNTVSKNYCSLTVRKTSDLWLKNSRTRRKTRTCVVSVSDLTTVIDPAPVEITWQIVVGTIAGITPFVVAGIEFSKRIIAQRKCETCGGSGLVSIEKNYFRCPECGGFLPWQSWKRFFSS